MGKIRFMINDFPSGMFVDEKGNPIVVNTLKGVKVAPKSEAKVFTEDTDAPKKEFWWQKE